jgi:hypothetical protein
MKNRYFSLIIKGLYIHSSYSNLLKDYFTRIGMSSGKICSIRSLKVY